MYTINYKDIMKPEEVEECSSHENVTPWTLFDRVIHGRSGNNGA